MDAKDFQTWLNHNGASLVVDGVLGQATRDAIKQVFVNTNARAVTEDQIRTLAGQMSCTYEQLASVANVESSGAPYDSEGRPKMLFERHKFSKYTDGKYDVCSYSNPDSGGYSEDSWDKLTQAACQDIDAAFKSASWGEFQIMGFWFPDIGFCSSLEMASITIISEYRHYYLFVGYIRLAGLLAELQRVSTNPDDCRPFAAGYNGPAYEDGGYHEKIAAEMVRLGG